MLDVFYQELSIWWDLKVFWRLFFAVNALIHTHCLGPQPSHRFLFRLCLNLRSHCTACLQPQLMQRWKQIFWLSIFYLLCSNPWEVEPTAGFAYYTSHDSSFILIIDYSTLLSLSFHWSKRFCLRYCFFYLLELGIVFYCRELAVRHCSILLSHGIVRLKGEDLLNYDQH